MAVIAIFILVSALVAVPVTYIANRTNTDDRSKACTWECTASCGCGCSDYFDARPECRQSAPPPPPNNPPPTTSCVANGCTYYSCTQQLTTDSCGARFGPVAGFCSTNYPASNPCGIGTTPTTPPSTGPPTSGGTPPAAGVCPAGQIQCGGCLNNLCYPASEGTCNTQIQNKCNTNPSCAGDGVFPAAGQNCCAGLTLYSNGRCGGPPASCIGAGGSKPTTGGSCCAGLFDCGTSCESLSSSCAAQPTRPSIAPGTQCNNVGGCICADSGRPMNDTWTCPGQISLGAGATCPNGESTCLCPNGSTIGSGTQCAGPTAPPASTATPIPIAEGVTCSSASQCSCPDGSVIPNGIPCPTTTRKLIGPGALCDSANGCTCSDTGKPMNYTWTCPRQIILTAGATCPNGESTCLCPDTTTITSGNKCAGTTAPPSATQTCVSPNTCVSTGLCTGNGGTLVTGYTCSTSGQSCCNYPVSPTVPAIPPGTQCNNAAGCTCADTGKPMNDTWTCPSAGGASCTNPWDCSSNLCIANKCASTSVTTTAPPTAAPTPKPIAIGETCASTSGCTCPNSTTVITNGVPCVSTARKMIGPGALCDSANGCTCSDTGKPMNYTWTCPQQITLTGGATCPNGESTCLCPDGKTITSGTKCAAASTTLVGANCSLPHGQFDTNLSLYCCTASTGTQAKYQTATCSGAQGYYIGGNDLPDGTWCTTGLLGGCARCSAGTSYVKNGNNYCGADPAAAPGTIQPGIQCKSANTCICADSGRIMQNTWTCPPQVPISTGDTCTATLGNTCICNGKTYMNGIKCAITIQNSCSVVSGCILWQLK